MINFFRSIRKKFITKGRSRNYLIYAFGEIFLVMIGILLALQVNNLNEDRKLKRTELSLLEEIQTNLRSTLDNFVGDTTYNRKTIVFYENILHHIENDLPYDQELDSAFASLRFFSTGFAMTSAYKSLQEEGLGIIKNKDLKINLQNVFDHKLTELETDVSQVEWDISSTIMNPFFTKHIRIIIDTNSTGLARPNDFESLKDNVEFHNILNLLIRERTRSILYYHDAMLVIKELLVQIVDELKARG